MLAHGKHKVIVIPDLQAPFQHPDTLPFLKYVRDMLEPDRVVCIGDSLDLHFASKYAKDPDGLSAVAEYEAGVSFMQDFYKIFPFGVEVDSNHNDRIHKRAFEAGLPSRFILSMRDLLKAPKEWDFVPHVEIDGVVYEHGHKQAGGAVAFKRAIKNKSIVIGHHHAHMGIGYSTNNGQTLFGMNVGCLIDVDQYAFKYAKGTSGQPTLGCGAVIFGTPVLFPMKVDKKNRWVGEL